VKAACASCYGVWSAESSCHARAHAKKDLQAAAAFKADLSGKIQAVVGENGQDIHAVCLQQIAQSDVQVRHVIIMDQARLPPPRS
jgi:hypothetical protein